MSESFKDIYFIENTDFIKMQFNFLEKKFEGKAIIRFFLAAETIISADFQNC